MRVILDLDGVLYKFEATARYLLDKEFDYPDLVESTYWSHLKDQVSPTAWAWLWSPKAVEAGLYRYGHLYKGAKDFVDRLTEEHEVVLVTSRPAMAVPDTLDWLAYHRIATQEVHVVANDRPKSSITGDVFIDDALHNMEDILAHAQNLKRFILVDRPWNRDVTQSPYAGPHERWVRALDWDDIFTALEEA